MLKESRYQAEAKMKRAAALATLVLISACSEPRHEVSAKVTTPVEAGKIAGVQQSVEARAEVPAEAAEAVEAHIRAQEPEAQKTKSP
ncbi:MULTISPECIES: hypothetical protein [unclassified Brevundimonas]|uniref:hypothetical protein n=1 Tax=unclassified Brevundimonas TaxID=2622653 RepID=UPI0025BE0981|nr:MULTISPECIES: hypothetical protein [unclassified Brevundimonas]